MNWLKLIILFLVSQIWLLAATQVLAQDDIDQLLKVLAMNSQKIKALSLEFKQQKTLNFTTKPITSSGRLCVQIDAQENLDFILWEYTQPLIAGFFLQQGQAKLWNSGRQSIQAATGYEKNIIYGMSQQIFTLIQMQTKLIKNTYNLEIISQTPPTLQLKYKQNTNMFTSLILTFNQDLTELQKIIFTEKNEDETQLEFYDILMNEPLPSYCQP